MKLFADIQTMSQTQHFVISKLILLSKIDKLPQLLITIHGSEDSQLAHFPKTDRNGWAANAGCWIGTSCNPGLFLELRSRCK